MAQKLTQERLKELLHYAPETGVFTWRQHMGSRAARWSTAGSESPPGYLSIGIDGTRYLSHRLAWLYTYGEFPSGPLDHKDQNGMNNAILNLRLVTRTQNGLNRGAQANNTSGYKGVTWHKQCRKWVAQIKIGSKHIHIGVFTNILDAVEARRKAESTLGVSEFCP